MLNWQKKSQIRNKSFKEILVANYKNFPSTESFALFLVLSEFAVQSIGKFPFGNEQIESKIGGTAAPK